MIFIPVYIFILMELIFVSYFDFRYQKISNRWSILNFVFYFLLLAALPSLYEWSWSALFFPLVFLVITFGLFAAKIMGAGDSKFLFTFYLIVPEVYQEDVFLFQAYLTVVIGGSLLIYNTFKNFDKLRFAYFCGDISIVRRVYGKKFAYAPVILGAWIWFGLYEVFLYYEIL